MLQKSNASPILGLTESPFFPHSDSSSHQGTELIFPFALGNTVSPPSSTSELHHTGGGNIFQDQHKWLYVMNQKKEYLHNYDMKLTDTSEW